MRDGTRSDGRSLRLSSTDSAPLGRQLRLRDGDLLLSVNGVPFQGGEKELASKIAEGRGNPVALTFQRGNHQIMVLSQTARLGQWEECPALAVDTVNRLNPDVLSNWEILVARDGRYDLHPLNNSILALIAAPVWLLQMRLWITGAALIAAAMVAAAVSPLMLLAVYLAGGLHFWHAGPKYVRKDRIARGLTPQIVLAAGSERAAHAAYLRLEPTARFLFAPVPPTTVTDKIA